MCGVAAALGREADVAAAVAALRHRGPDRTAVVAAPPGAVGAARLRINGDERADQPLRGRRGLLLALNGEVFNHAALGPTPPGGGDGAPLVAALEAEGPAALRLVRGPFAVAALDPADGSLLLGRDEHGIRPLFVDEDASSVLAASEIRPLLEARRAPARLDAAAVAGLLAFQFPPEDRTLFRGIAPLPAGCARRYRLEDGGLRRTASDASYDGPAETTPADALTAAARLQGPCPKRSAIFLSGGLDSSIVLGLLAEAGFLPSFAMVGWFPEAGPEFDERPHARAVAAEAGVPLVEVAITGAAALRALPAVVRALGGPVAGPGSLAQYVLAEAARAEGASVVFTGQGGDELFGGYERHRILQRIELGLDPAPRAGYEALAKSMASSADPLAAALFRGAELLPLLEPAAARAVLDALRAALPAPGPGRAQRAADFEFARLLPGLLAVDDRTLSAFGLEGRAPLLDPVVSRLARAVPLSEKSPHDEPRRLLRRAAGARLPAAAGARRDKMGFPMPLDRWLGDAWRGEAAARLAPDALAAFGFRPGAARAAVSAGTLSPRGRWFVAALAAFEADLASLASLSGAGAGVGAASSSAPAPAAAAGSAG